MKSPPLIPALQIFLVSERVPTIIAASAFKLRETAEADIAGFKLSMCNVVYTLLVLFFGAFSASSFYSTFFTSLGSSLSGLKPT